MRTARRYAATAEDAEDAYQRGVEIMLTKAPDIPEAELLPWLKTVVRHEAYALRRKDERILLGLGWGDGGVNTAEDFECPSATPAEKAELYEHLHVAAEALQGLKPHERQALALLAQGYSYRQICEETGWTYTKVNRCLAEGRKSFLERVTGIERGAECERFAPALSALADGEATSLEVTPLRRHLRGCLACRAELRELRRVPALVGALAPLPSFERFSWLTELLGELHAAIKVKLATLARALPVDASSSPSQLALSGGSRGLASPGLAKALAALCLGSAGAGGVAVVEEVLGPRESNSAEAVTPGPESGFRPRAGEPVSPDPRLVAERFRPPARRQSSSNEADGPEHQPRPKAPSRNAADEIVRPSRSANGVRPARPSHSTRARSSSEGLPDSDSGKEPEPTESRCPDEADRGDGPAPTTGTTEPEDHYEHGAGPASQSDDQYDQGARPPAQSSDHYEKGAAPPSPQTDNYGEGAQAPSLSGGDSC